MISFGRLMIFPDVYNRDQFVDERYERMLEERHDEEEQELEFLLSLPEAERNA